MISIRFSFELLVEFLSFGNELYAPGYAEVVSSKVKPAGNQFVLIVNNNSERIPRLGEP